MADNTPIEESISSDLTRKPFSDALLLAAQIAIDRIEYAMADLNGDVPAAMLYAVKGGKGLRAFFALESARLHGIAYDFAGGAAGAIEAMHAYSLVHDDLPCMDDDDLRRGQPTVHRKWNEATAVLAGDALQALAFTLVAKTKCEAQAKIMLMTSLAIAAGVRGMVGGQAADIAAESTNKPLTLDEVVALQAGKTGALIEWSCKVGPMATGRNVGSMHDYGSSLGLAFQITDDILDVEGDAATVGKAVGKDTDAGKATFVSLLGLDGAKRRAAELVESAQDALSPYGEDADTLREAAQFVLTRKK